MNDTNDQTQHTEPSNVLPPVQQSADPAAAVPATNDFAGHVPANQTMPVASSLVPAPDAAADNDLIEKEWVDKAKNIVEHTVSDPFTQQEELSKMKADYMKKRYNKDLGAN